MICFPNAKINIGLNVVRKREDGYHDIETMMYPLKGILCDALEVIESQEFEVRSSGIQIPGNENENLCAKAYRLIQKDYAVPPVKTYLHKAIPIGAGLGGGSADAAFFIRLLNDAFQLGISWGEMHHYARQLGSDCSFFISNRPSFAEGRGDQFESTTLDLSNYFIALVYPAIHISTAQAYSGVKPKDAVRSLENDVQQLPVEEWKKYIHNDFEDSAFLQHPELGKIKEKLYSCGAIYASMSGSGSSIYGIFKKEPKVKKIFSKFYSWEGKL
jgi:4-diphosphocytidyl-2-C-methyl-D-erythritol kinase